MKIGILYCAYNTEDYPDMSLTPWMAARQARPSGDEYIICAVSVPFVGFPNGQPDGTVDRLRDLAARGHIDHLITSDEPMKETEARGAGLDYLMERGAEAIWQVDADEEYLPKDITSIIEYVKANPFVAWFRLCLKNYVFDQQTYLVEPFAPARIHRVQFGALRATHFVADNDIAYGETNPRDLSTMTVPKNTAWVRHLTWGNDLRSKAKVAYHEAHFNSRPSGVRSSFAWDDEKGLVFNEAYYRYMGLAYPQTARD